MIQQYLNDKQCREFLKSISKYERSQQVERINCSPQPFTIMLDASTDSSEQENAVVYIRYCANEEAKPQTEFLGIDALPGGDAASYEQLLETMLIKRGFPDWKRRLIGLGTDGCNTMRGKHNGLAARIERQVPNITTIHCVAHNLQLAIMDAAQDLPYLSEKFEPTLKKLFQFYHYSPTKQRGLTNVAQLLEEDIVRLGNIHTVRWVASKVRALNALRKDWKVVVTHLEEIGGSQSASNDQATAIGLLRTVKSEHFIRMVHFLIDLLSIIQKLSLFFQRSDVCASIIPEKVESTIRQLKQMENTPKEGGQLVDFLDMLQPDGTFQGHKLVSAGRQRQSEPREALSEERKLVLSAIQCVKERFQGLFTHPIIRACKIFDPDNWPLDEDNIEQYGLEEVDLLVSTYSKHLKSHEDSEGSASSMKASAKEEWADLYQLLRRRKAASYEQVYNATLSARQRFPLLSQVLQVTALLPMSTADCERGFSVTNRIKTTLRNRMDTSTLDDLIFAHCNGPSLANFNPVPAIQLWQHGHHRHLKGHAPGSGRKSGSKSQI